MREFIVQTDMDLNGVVEFTGAGGVSFKPKEEIIRCKDCKFYVPQYDKKGFYCGNCQYMQTAEINGYCHMAKRKEE